MTESWIKTVAVRHPVVLKPGETGRLIATIIRLHRIGANLSDRQLITQAAREALPPDRRPNFSKASKKRIEELMVAAYAAMGMVRPLKVKMPTETSEKETIPPARNPAMVVNIREPEFMRIVKAMSPDCMVAAEPVDFNAFVVAQREELGPRRALTEDECRERWHIYKRRIIEARDVIEEVRLAAAKEVEIQQKLREEEAGPGDRQYERDIAAEAEDGSSSISMEDSVVECGLLTQGFQAPAAKQAGSNDGLLLAAAAIAQVNDTATATQNAVFDVKELLMTVYTAISQRLARLEAAVARKEIEGRRLDNNGVPPEATSDAVAPGTKSCAGLDRLCTVMEPHNTGVADIDACKARKDSNQAVTARA